MLFMSDAEDPQRRLGGRQKVQAVWGDKRWGREQEYHKNMCKKDGQKCGNKLKNYWNAIRKMTKAVEHRRWHYAVSRCECECACFPLYASLVIHCRPVQSVLLLCLVKGPQRPHKPWVQHKMCLKKWINKVMYMNICKHTTYINTFIHAHTQTQSIYKSVYAKTLKLQPLLPSLITPTNTAACFSAVWARK